MSEVVVDTLAGSGLCFGRLWGARGSVEVTDAGNEACDGEDDNEE
jgi:hypothetical protein